MARYRDLCLVCREPTESFCFRCKAPLCPQHAPAQGRRCASCEKEFQSWPSREPRVIAAGLILAAMWTAGTLELLGFSPPASILWALLFPAAVALFARRALHDGRELFLRQEKRRRAEADSRQLGV